MRDRKPMRVRDLAGTIGALTFCAVFYYAAVNDWNAWLGFMAAGGAAGAVHWVVDGL